MLRAAKSLLLIAIILSVPVTILAQGKSLLLLREALPLWAFAGVALSYIISLAGIGLLIDTRREQAGLPPL